MEKKGIKYCPRKKMRIKYCATKKTRIKYHPMKKKQELNTVLSYEKKEN